MRAYLGALDAATAIRIAGFILCQTVPSNKRGPHIGLKFRFGPCGLRGPWLNFLAKNVFFLFLCYIDE
jgi:hypothetical protein